MNETESIGRLIDHALLHPTMTDDDIRKGCQLAAELNLMSVCVKPYAVKLAADLLEGSETCICTVIGFPHGSHSTEVKVFEAECACKDGATELDMVINIGKALQGDWEYVRNDIASVVETGHKHGAIVKVIFETDYVSKNEDKLTLCKICEDVGADFVKTSTGFGFVKQATGGYGYMGATEDDVKLMRSACSDSVGVKASGGIRSYEDATKFRKLGAARLGTSASKAIIDGQGIDDSSY